MNILLYLPGLLVLLFQYEGVLGSITCVAIIFATQVSMLGLKETESAMEVV